MKTFMKRFYETIVESKIMQNILNGQQFDLGNGFCYIVWTSSLISPQIHQ